LLLFRRFCFSFSFSYTHGYENSHFIVGFPYDSPCMRYLCLDWILVFFRAEVYSNRWKMEQ
jgi:hypothetical protein